LPAEVTIVRRVAGDRLRIGPIEAIDGTPVVDIKPVAGQAFSVTALER
jgi:tRNA (Thr-GGU) A37 N-methylase